MSYVNEAGWDRAVRVVLGVVLVALGFGVVGGTAGTVLGVVGLIPLVTGATGFCPLYAVAHFRTNHTESA